ncbi:MAG: RNA ligase family protein [Clostridiales bacterium]|nr:RNA ligase family protein [Clostridiales bacterium]
MCATPLVKYPRTPHLEGSRLQPGDEDLSQVPFAAIAGRTIVVEEKCDGANAAVSFDAQGGLRLQSRGHYLTGGYRERHYGLLKRWATVHQAALRKALGARYVMYGEWLYAKHTVYYNALPHYFLEFDVLDRERNVFLDTSARRALLGGLPIVSAPVLARASFATLPALTSLLGVSGLIQGDPLADLRAYCQGAGEDADLRCAQTDATRLMEGLYLKAEANGVVTARMKFVRASYLQGVAAHETGWHQRPVIPNRLLYPVEALFETALPPVTGALR